MDIGILLIGIEYDNEYKLDGTINDIIKYYNLFNNYYTTDNIVEKNNNIKIDTLLKKNKLLDTQINKFKKNKNFKKIIEINQKKNLNYSEILQLKKCKFKKNINLHYHILTDNINKVKSKIDNNNILYDEANYENIINYLKILSDEFKYIHICYSGHGSYIKDLNNDEYDNRDECLVPSDYKLITDDLLNREFVKKLKIDIKCRIIIDSCHSGTIFDLQYLNNKDIGKNKIFSDIIVVSGCRDKQYSYETFFKNKTFGVLTYNLNNIIDKNYNLSDMYMLINENMSEQEFKQNMMITSSKKIINKKFMFL